MRRLEKVNFIVIHAADTKSSMDTTVKDLHKWHVTENGWSDIGYHWFIKFDGTVHVCRAEAYQGAHCKTVNDKSIAICLEGGYGGVNNFTDIQLQSLMHLIEEKKFSYDNAAVVGHNHFDDKACPCFSVVNWYENSLID